MGNDIESKKKFNTRRLFSSNFATLIMVLILVIALFGLLNKNFLTYTNAMNILFASSCIGIMAIGMAFLIISGNIDLSSGNVAAFSGILCALLIKMGLPWPLAFFITLAVAACIGLINATLVNGFGMQPFIATLAVSSVFQGLGYVICGGKGAGLNVPALIFFGAGRIFGVPVPVIILVIFFLVYSFILIKTKFGRTIYIIGGNRIAAYLAGIKYKKISTFLYMQNSMLAAIAGIMMASRMHHADPQALSMGVFDAITAVILGGVAFTGGTGSLIGVFLGLILIQTFNNGLTVVGASAFWQISAKGALLIIALLIDYFRRRRAEL